jgi:hypothetical protein
VTDKRIDSIARGCAEKSRYGTESAAQHYARLHSARYGVEMYAYECSYGCGGFHLAKGKR